MNKKKKKVKISPEKFPATCTISEDPRAVLCHVEKRVKTNINLTPAHKPALTPCISPKPRDMTSPVQLTRISDDSMATKWHEHSRVDSSHAIEALNSYDDYRLLASKCQRTEGQLRTSTPLRTSALVSLQKPQMKLHSTYDMVLNHLRSTHFLKKWKSALMTCTIQRLALTQMWMTSFSLTMMMKAKEII